MNTTPTPLISLDLERLNREFEDKSATDILGWVYASFAPDTVKLSTSFGAEGMALLHMLVELVKTPRVFTVDTGRNFPQTYEVWQQAIKKYAIPIETYWPDPRDIAELASSKGPNLLYDSVENRRQCCHVRKVKPLDQALKGASVWLTGLRRQQGPARSATPIISYSEKYGLYKVCPLANWDESHVWYYIRGNDIPYNKLHDSGYPTIGCEPCTRPVRPAEDIRMGRWWWESTENKECGIHIEDGKVVAKQKLNFDI